MSAAAPSADARPFVIWTLQRTGGTNLTKHLSQRSPFKPVQQEPFNKPRIYGEITKAWLADRNAEALRAAVTEVCARHELIKHCVEMVPLEVSRALAECASAAGYRHMFLYRRDPLGRILSKEYAQRTKVWGPSHIAKAENDAEAFVTPLDVAQLLKEETRNVDWLNRVWKLLHAHKAPVTTIAYEDLYGPDADLAARALARLLDGLALSQGPEKDAAMLADLRGTGDQNTRDRYARFQGQEALRDGLASLPPLACAR